MSGLFVSNITPEQITHIEEWIAALRSGEYKQTIETLKDDKGFCCLGVACDISKVSEWRGEKYLGASIGMPPKVQFYFGIQGSEGSMSNRDYHSLTIMNDCGESFQKIAAVIEEELALCK